MIAPAPARVADDEVFALTDLGQSQIKDAKTSLSSAALKVLVLIDGRSNAKQLMNGMPVLSPSEVRENLGVLLAGGYIRSMKSADADLSYIDPGDFFKTIGKPVRLAPGVTMTGNAEALAGLSSLREEGYFVSIAHRSGVPDKPAETRRVALVVDDDADVGNLLEIFLRGENFDVIVAHNKNEVVEALRRPAPPDLALLDVSLPDVDGFHILSRMRQHPRLKTMGIIMLTASATRADVLKGLHFGADGYVTKPFNFEVLMKAVRTVLGLAEPDAWR
jgi:two-component system OmpR family response regulator